jgi:hypothetical protein
VSLALHLRLRGEPEAAAIARRAIGATLDGTPMLDVDLVSLVVTELIGRLSHPQGGEDLVLDVHVDLNPRRVRVHVTGPPRRQDAPTTPLLAAGWSLLLIERTVDRWGIDDGPTTRVWFENDLAPSDRPEARATDTGADTTSRETADR